jgi:hypothetical protein
VIYYCFGCRDAVDIVRQFLIQTQVLDNAIEPLISIKLVYLYQRNSSLDDYLDISSTSIIYHIMDIILPMTLLLWFLGNGVSPGLEVVLSPYPIWKFSNDKFLITDYLVLTNRVFILINDPVVPIDMRNQFTIVLILIMTYHVSYYYKDVMNTSGIHLSIPSMRWNLL